MADPKEPASAATLLAARERAALGCVSLCIDEMGCYNSKRGMFKRDLSARMLEPGGAIAALVEVYEAELGLVTRERDEAQGKLVRFDQACEALTRAERAFRKIIDECGRRSLCSPEAETDRAAWLAAYNARNAASAERDAALAALRERTPR